MARLLSMTVVRNPKPAPPPREGDGAIFTHPPSTPHPAGIASLHDRLHEAWQRRDWSGLAEQARAHLEASEAGRPLHPVSQAAIAFLRPTEVAATAADIRNFLGDLECSAREYFAGPYREDRARLADEALALHCLGALGEAKSNPIAALRSLTTLERLAAAPRTDRETPDRRLEALYTRCGTMDVYLPHWSFEIDICGDLVPVFHPSGPVKKTPLELRLEQMERLRNEATGDCDCEPEPAECQPQSVCCPELKYFLTDLLELRQRTHSYVAADLANIAVVGAGEHTERKHRFRSTREIYAETEDEVRSMEKRDQHVTDSGRFTREIERQTETNLKTEAGMEGKFWGGAYKITASASLSYEKSASQAIKEAQEQAREVVTQAAYELEKHARVLRSERLTTEEEEENLHSWDNAAGTQPKITKYFWVRRLAEARLFSHGPRLLMEMIVPQPAKHYLQLIEKRIEAEVIRRIGSFDGVKPPAPPALSLKPDEITRDNYKQLAFSHGVTDAPAPPAAYEYASGSGSNGLVGNHVANLPPITITVPQGYRAIRMDLSGEGAKYRTTGTGAGRFVHFHLEGTVWFGAGGDQTTANLSGHTGTVSIAVTAANIKSYSGTITLTCEVDAATMAAWQKSVFDLIASAHETKVKAYEAALKAYEEALADYREKADKIEAELRGKMSGHDPFFNRVHEQTQIKRAVIYLMCENYSADSAWIETAEPCGFSEIDRHAVAERGYGWYFWDRLFDWKYMAYAFFDYFRTPICEWPERFDPADPDALFQAFLSAGYTRVLVPVSKGMEQDFLWYASTLQKWGASGEPPLDPNDPRWRNVLYELKFANENAMTAREGHVENVGPGDLSVLVKGTDRYWDSLAGQVDAAAVAADVDREIFIDGEAYLVAGIQAEPGSPPFTGSSDMWWRITLDRPYAGAASPRELYAMGAQAVAPPFRFEVPTELVWAGAHDECLPAYPLPPC